MWQNHCTSVLRLAGLKWSSRIPWLSVTTPTVYSGYLESEEMKLSQAQRLLLKDSEEKIY